MLFIVAFKLLEASPAIAIPIGVWFLTKTLKLGIECSCLVARLKCGAAAAVVVKRLDVAVVVVVVVAATTTASVTIKRREQQSLAFNHPTSFTIRCNEVKEQRHQLERKRPGARALCAGQRARLCGSPARVGR